MAGFFLLYSVAMSQAAATIVTDLTEWESMVSNVEVFTTVADNIAVADEVISLPGDNSSVGPVLTFQSTNTGLSTGFKVETLESNAEFIFNEGIGSGASDDWRNALSVGNFVTHSDDDWSLSLLNGDKMMAFGIEIRNSRNLTDETITLYLMSNNDTVATFNLSSEPNDNHNLFIGIVSDVPFDRVVFNENPDDDHIAIADFRFASVLPSEIEAVVDIDPNTINLKSKGRYVTAYIELPEGYSVEEIDRGSVVISAINGDAINPPIHTVGPWQIGDHDRDGITDLMVKFDRQELIPLLKVTDKTITVSGELADGTQFAGTDNSRIIKHKKKFCHFNNYRHLFKKWNSR
jgi:hypothetical protein